MSSQHNEVKNLSECILEISKKLSTNSFIDTEKSNNQAASFKKTISLYLEESPSEISEIFDIAKQLISNKQKLNKEQKKSPKKDNKLIIYNKNIFNIFPFIFDINPKLSFKYINNFTALISLFISENNKTYFSYIGDNFSEIIIIFFNNIELSIEEKKYIYTQILSFCLDIIKTNNKFEQSFGCLILTELIEKCCLFQIDEKILETLWKYISKFLEDKWFVCKLDILNCALSLIFVSESKFKKYANECLFKILDYLTGSDWMQRKIAINIIYTLVFYCKTEIFNVKKNIVEFLTIVKDDPVSEVREVCIQTLNFINEQEQLDNENDDSNNINIKEKEELSSQNNNTINYDLEKENEDELLINKDSNKENESNNEKEIFDSKKSKAKIRIKTKNNKISHKSKKNNKNNNSFVKSTISNNEHINQSHSFINSKIKNHKSTNSLANQNKVVPYYRPNLINMYNKSSFTITKKSSNKTTKKSFYSIHSANSKKNESTFIQNKCKINNTSQTKKNNPKAITKNKTSNNLKELKAEKSVFNKTSLLLINENHSPEVINNININNFNKEVDNTKNQTINYENNKDNKFEYNINKEEYLIDNNNININNEIEKNNLKEDINNNVKNFEAIMNIFNKIQEEQNSILKRLEKLEQKMEDNYSNFDKRIKLIEKDLSDIKQKNIYNTSDNNNDDKTLISIKNKILNGTYDEALAKAIQNDEYLYSILPLLNDVNINFIDASVLEDIISRLSLKLARINKNDDAGIINIILNFFNNLICAGINIRMVVKMNLKDSFEILLNENKDIISKNDIHILNNILDKLKI